MFTFIILILMFTLTIFIIASLLSVIIYNIHTYRIRKYGTWIRINGTVISHKNTKIKWLKKAQILYKLNPHAKQMTATTVAMLNPPPIKKKANFDMVIWTDKYGKSKNKIYYVNSKNKQVKTKINK